MQTRVARVWDHIRHWQTRRKLHWVFVALLAGVWMVILGGMLWAYWPTLVAFRWQVRWGPLAIGALLYPFDLLLAAFAWACILEGLGERRLSFREHWRIYAGTLAAGRIPGAPWHIAGRAALYDQQQVSKRVVGVASGLEIILMIISGLLTGIFITPVLIKQVTPWIWGGAIFLGLGALHPSMIRWLLKLLKCEAPPPRPYWERFIWLALYGLVWMGGGAILYCLINTLYPLSISALPYVIGIWGFSGAISVMAFFSPSGLGIREITLTTLLTFLLPVGLSLVVAVIARIFFTVLEIISAIMTPLLIKFIKTIVKNTP